MSQITEDLNRLNENIKTLFEKRDDTVKELNTLDSTVKVMASENASTHSQQNRDIDELKLRVTALETFKTLHEGEERGRGWVQKYIPWLIIIAQFIFSLLREATALLRGGPNP